jgi:hypothetical protein
MEQVGHQQAGEPGPAMDFLGKEMTPGLPERLAPPQEQSVETSNLAIAGTFCLGRAEKLW